MHVFCTPQCVRAPEGGVDMKPKWPILTHQYNPGVCHTELSPLGPSENGELGGWVNKECLVSGAWLASAGKGGVGYTSLLMGHQGTNLTGASFVLIELIADNGTDTVTVLTDVWVLRGLRHARHVFEDL